MSIDIVLRAYQLIDIGRFEQALELTEKLLADDPECSDAYHIRAVCFCHKDDYPAASEAAEMQLRLCPDDVDSHTMLGKLYAARNRFEQAEEIADRSKQLDPEDVGVYELYADIRLGTKKWEEALWYADRGLELDPDSTSCRHTRVRALQELGRTEEAEAESNRELQENPEEWAAHMQQGTNKMLLRDFDAAEQHFVEAIRLDPQNELAKDNLLESLKARSTLYRGFLSFAIWLSGLSPTARWTIIGLAVAGWFGANRAAVTFPNLFWFFKAIELTLGMFFIFTYVGPILVNFAVSLSPRGRYALTKERMLEARSVTGMIVVAATLATLATVVESRIIWRCAVAAFVIIPPIVSIFDCEVGWPRNAMIGLSIMVGVIAVVGVFLPVLVGRRGVLLAFFVAYGLSFWLEEVQPKT